MPAFSYVSLSGGPFARLNEAGLRSLSPPTNLVWNRAIFRNRWCNGESINDATTRRGGREDRCDLYFLTLLPKLWLRKPKTGMLERAAREHGLDVTVLRRW